MSWSLKVSFVAKEFFQLLVSKVGGQTHKNCFSPFMKFWTWNLEFPTHAEHKFFAFGLQLSALKVEG
jgi:hypothetical protein